MDQPLGSFRLEPEQDHFDGLVKLHLRSPSNRITKRFAMDLHLEVNEFLIDIRSKPSLMDRVARQFGQGHNEERHIVRLVVRLRHCHVRYAERGGVIVVPDTKYRNPVEVGKYQESAKAHGKSERESGASGDVYVQVDLKLASPAAKFGVKGKANYSQSDSERAEREVLVVKDLYEVETIPSGWRVGDRVLGDPLKRGGYLDGPYFRNPVDAHPNTCEIEFSGDAKSGSLTFTVSAYDGIRVERVDGLTVSDEQADLAERRMRDRLAAIRVERAQGGREIELFSVICHCELGEEAAADVTPPPPALPAPPLQIEGSAKPARKPRAKRE
jgi:hypothetical protein